VEEIPDGEGSKYSYKIGPEMVERNVLGTPVVTGRKNRNLTRSEPLGIGEGNGGLSPRKGGFHRLPERDYWGPGKNAAGAEQRGIEVVRIMRETSFSPNGTSNRRITSEGKHAQQRAENVT